MPCLRRVPDDWWGDNNEAEQVLAWTEPMLVFGRGNRRLTSAFRSTRLNWELIAREHCKIENNIISMLAERGSFGSERRPAPAYLAVSQNEHHRRMGVPSVLLRANYFTQLSDGNCIEFWDMDGCFLRLEYVSTPACTEASSGPTDGFMGVANRGG